MSSRWSLKEQAERGAAQHGRARPRHGATVKRKGGGADREGSTRQGCGLFYFSQILQEPANLSYLNLFRNYAKI